jgi:hypothetical protein
MGLGPDWLLENGLAERLRDEGFSVELKTVSLDGLYPAELAVGFFLHRAIAASWLPHAKKEACRLSSPETATAA